MNRTSHLHDRIDQPLLQVTLAGLAFSLLLPFAQVNTQSFGWLPLWLVGLPLSAWLGRRVLGRRAGGGGAMPLRLPALARGRARGTAPQARRRQFARQARRTSRHVPMA